jgi:hypothetical protein
MRADLTASCLNGTRAQRPCPEPLLKAHAESGKTGRKEAPCQAVSSLIAG